MSKNKEEAVAHLIEFFNGVSFGLRHPEAFQMEPKGVSRAFESFNRGIEVGEAIHEDILSGKKLGLTVSDIVELELEKIRLNHFI